MSETLGMTPHLDYQPPDWPAPADLDVPLFSEDSLFGTTSTSSWQSHPDEAQMSPWSDSAGIVEAHR